MDTYEKKYKEIVGLIKKAYLYAQTDSTKAVFEEIFPELAESEDERIRKAIHIYLDWLDGRNKDYQPKGDYSIKDMITWLEKQVEQKPVVIIPKFRIGDNIKTTNEEPLTITKIDDKGYWSEDLLICGFDDAAKWELVEQKPAWSEEDEAHIHSLLDRLNGMCKKGSTFITTRFAVNQDIDWLKSLRQRIEGE